MAYIKPQNRDTRYPLWFDRYQVRVPYIQTLSVEELSEHGLPTSGDIHHDHAMQWEPRLISITIVKMAMLWSQGANVALVNRTDAPKIYEAIMAHLHAWKHHMANSYHVINPPYDDLLMLDQFANIVYEKAKFAYDQKFIEKHFKLSSNSAIGRRAMLAAMSRSDERRRDDAEKGILRIRNIDFREATPKYDPDAERTMIDYSGKNAEYDAPQRQSLSSFFKKGKN